MKLIIVKRMYHSFLKRLKFSWKISIICLVLATCMLRLSFWQWERYIAKEHLLNELNHRINLPIISLQDAIEEVDEKWNELLHRRVSVSGEWDFSHEIVKRNRKDDIDGAGVHIITPLLLSNSFALPNSLQQEKNVVLINRGFIPYSYKSKEDRARFRKTPRSTFNALVKLSEKPRWALSPADPTSGSELPWVDEWLRVNLSEIEKQLPYSLLPIHLELMETSDIDKSKKEIVANSKSREEIFLISDHPHKIKTGKLTPNREYPVPAYSTVVPSATHLLYVFEWIFMALGTLLGGLILQLKRHN